MSDAESPLKTLAFGAALLAGGLWFWHYCVKNPFNDLALIERGQTADGTLIDTAEDEQEEYRGNVYYSDVGVYSFHVNGRDFRAITRAPTGSLSPRQTIEFLSDDPGTNRVVGDGSQSVWDWAWRKLGLGLVLLALFAYPGLKLIRDAVLGFKRQASRTYEA